MTGSNLWSDGNALAGPLQDVFRVDVTTAVGRCTACGAWNRPGSMRPGRVSGEANTWFARDLPEGHAP